MTVQRDKLATLLAEIDAILGGSGPRLPWVMSNDAQQQRQTLAKAREMLVELQQSQDNDLPRPTGQELASAGANTVDVDPTAMASSQVLQALLQEMQYLRGQTMQILDPLRNEVSTLKQQRELLLQEVQQLQQQRLQLDPGTVAAPSAEQWESMLQQLTSQLEAHLSQQLQQSVQRLETSAANTYLLGQNDATDPDGSANLTPTQRLEYLKHIQAQSDHLVMNLDRVLRTVFDSLQQSIYSYQDSLNHGLNKMHTLGQQGEMMFNALINHLAQQMNQETLAYLETSQPGGSRTPQLPDVRGSESPTSSARGQTPSSAANSGSGSASGRSEIDLDDLDLDVALNDDEVTLLQIDDEISQLQFDIDRLDAEGEADYGTSAQLSQDLPTSPDSGDQSSVSTYDPLQVLDQLDEAVPNPDPSVSLPAGTQSDTLEARVIAADSEGDAADEGLDDLYQSIFGDVLADAAPQSQSSGGLEEPAEAADSEDRPSTAASITEAAFSSESPLGASPAGPSGTWEPAEADIPDPTNLDDITTLLETADAEPQETLANDPIEADDSSLDELFGEGTAQHLAEVESIDADDDEADIITSLDELLPESQLASIGSFEDSGSGVDETAFDALEGNPWTEDADFIAADTEEDLLSSNELPQAGSYSLQVDQDIVDRLDADLSNLESGNASSDEGSAGSGNDALDIPQPSELPNALDESWTDFGTNLPEKISSEEPAALLEENLADVGEDFTAVSPPPAAPETLDENFASFGNDLPETTTPEDTAVSLEASFADFGDDAPEDFGDDATDISPAQDIQAIPEDDPMGLVDTQGSPSLADETVEDAFGAFGTDDVSSDESTDTTPAAFPYQSVTSDNNLWSEVEQTVEENRMPIGDLPSQESVEALLSELNLDLGPDEAAIGESGLTLDALESLAEPPGNEPAGSPSVSFSRAEIPQPPGAESVSSGPEETSSPSKRAEEALDSSLTLENLVGELKLDPLFPDPADQETLPPITADNIFADESESTPSASPQGETLDQTATPSSQSDSPTLDSEGIDLFGKGRQNSYTTARPTEEDGVDLFGETPPTAPTPSTFDSPGLDLFGDMPPAEPAPAESENTGLDSPGLDLFGDISPAEPAPAESENTGLDLFGEPSLANPAPVEPRSEGIDQGIDLFGDIPPSESSSRATSGGEADVFGEQPPIQPGPVEAEPEGIDLFSDTSSAPTASPEPEGIDLFNEAPPMEPTPGEAEGGGIDLFSSSSSSSISDVAPEPADEAVTNWLADPVAPSADENVPPITLEDLDLSLGDEPLEDSPAETGALPPLELDQESAPLDELFGDAFPQEPADLPPADMAGTLPDGSEDLFGDRLDQPINLPSQDEGLTDDGGLTDDEGLSPLAVEASFQAQDATSSVESDLASESDRPEVKYTEWLSDISLENILGTVENSADPAMGSEQPQSAPAEPLAETDDIEPAAPAEAAPNWAPEPEPQSPTELNVEDQGDDVMSSMSIVSLDDLAAAMPAPEDPSSLDEFRIPEDAGDAEPVSDQSDASGDQDLFNLDTLLEDSLADSSENSSLADSISFEEEENLTQDFDTEIEFIDLDALLADSSSESGPEAGDDLRQLDPELDLSPDEDGQTDSNTAPRIGEMEDSAAVDTNPLPEEQSANAAALDLLDTSSPMESTQESMAGANLDELELAVPEATSAAEGEAQNAVEEVPDLQAWQLSEPSTGVKAQALPQNLVEDPVDLVEPPMPADLPDVEPGVVNRTTEVEPPAEAAEATPAAIPEMADSLIEEDVVSAGPLGAEPPAAAGEDETDGMWFLGLDIGAQGISAVLLRRRSGQVFPLYWLDTRISGATADKFFRLPTIAAVAPTAEAYTVQSVGSSALMVNWEDSDTAADSEEDTILLKSLKPFLKMGLPFNTEAAAEPQPMIRWSDAVQLPLQVFETALRELFKTLLQPGAEGSPLMVGAVGLQPEDITDALHQLRGVVISYPANWPDTYPFNVREAIIKAGLVHRPDDIYFLEDAIAAVLSGLPDPAEPSPEATGQPVQQQTLYSCHWTGGTAVISAGATVTELGLANLPQDLGQVTYHDFALHSMAYAGDAIDLDIICHLLHPPERRQPRTPDRYRGPSNADDWSWQAAMPELDAAQWDELDLDSLEFPRVAEPDLSRRYRLQQRLESSLLGQSLLEAVRHLKIILQHQPQFELELADQRWIVRSKDLEDRIILPYIQRLNGHLNKLLSEVGLTTQGINQVICTGGSASLPKISRWLRQKFPNATIIQDTYHSDRPPSCSRVAYGLVNLMRYPQVLDLTRHQYSDMFLLMELLRTLPDQPMPLSGILHLLQERGINTEACELHLMALLEGRLPPGLLPAINHPFVDMAAAEQPDFQALLTTPLFSRPNNQIYVPNPDQCQRLLNYLETILADKRQTLRDPLLLNLMAVSV